MKRGWLLEPWRGARALVIGLFLSKVGEASKRPFQIAFAFLIRKYCWKHVFVNIEQL